MRCHSFRPVHVIPALLVAVLMGLPSTARAQEEDQNTGPELGGYNVQGQASLGYRFTDVTGRRQKYQELYNLNEGLRLVDFSLFGQAQKGQTGALADMFSVTANGIGGDPFPAVQVMVRKNGLYDFRGTWRQSHYFWDRADATLPNGLNATGSNHAWDTKRDFGNANLLVHLTDHLRAGFELQRANRSGMTITTRSPDYFGAPGSWGSFARANPYSIAAPLAETANRYAGSLDYTNVDWTVHYSGGYQTFDDSIVGTALNAPEVSINIDDSSSAREVLDQGSYQDYRRLTTPISELTYVGRIHPQLRYSGGYTYYRYAGPAGLQAAYDGAARNSFAPYSLSFDTRADVSEPTHSVHQALTWEATKGVNVLLDYRYTNVAINTSAQFHSTFDGTAADGESQNQWREHRNLFGASVQLMPQAGLLVQGGFRMLQNDVRMTEDGIVNEDRTKTIKTFWPTVSVYYKPSKIVSVRADLDEINRDVSYTRTTPHTDVGSRVLIRIQPTDAISIEETLNVRNQKLDATDYRNRVRSNALMARYQFSDAFSLYGGFSYDDLHATGTASFIRGSAPLDVTLDDRETDHVWQGGASARIAGFGFDLAGNYVKTTGAGTISGEDPRYGPLTSPYVTGTVYYEFPEAGRLSVDIQHVRYTEELLTADNFSARMVMVRWTRGF